MPKLDPPLPRFLPYVLVLPGGVAAIEWQLLWQHHASLALGVSAQATALVVATTMGGMMAGALWAGRWLPRVSGVNPWKLYAGLEAFAAVTGNLFRWFQEPIGGFDATVFRAHPGLAPLWLVAATMIAIGPATLAIGATAPVLGLLAERCGTPVSRLYAVNTAGAAIGAIWLPFVLIPPWGISGSEQSTTLYQITGALLCWGLGPKTGGAAGTGASAAESSSPAPVTHANLLAFATGWVTFVLELTWFRMIRSAWLSTVDSFAVVLFAFLIALAGGAWLGPVLRRWGRTLPQVLGLGAMLILVASLAIERIDLIPIPADNLGWKRLIWLGLALVSMGPPVALLGTSLPWLFDAAREPRAWARLYAWNTLGCALGALGAAWLLLPVSGPVNLAIITGLLLGSFCLVLLKRPVAAGMLLIFLFILRDDHRLTGASPLLKVPHQVLAQEHGQDVTTAVIEARGGRALMIDGYAASGEYGAATKYMDAMGRLPMLLHEDPRDALVICFGTGQTAQALRDEQAERITAVDVNPAVFRFAKYFPTNRGVLNDPKLQAIVMDGRAWLRRTEQQYDVITLEPMPPMFAGTNALYSVEFYRLIASRLRPGGIAAQWFPMHLLSPENARAVAAAFRTVFPEAVLWIDPSNADARGTPQQGVLLGAAEPRDWNRWPGFARPLDHARPLEERTYRESIELRPEGLKVYARARPVTDDNLLLTHGSDRHLESAAAMSLARLTVEAIREAARADR